MTYEYFWVIQTHFKFQENRFEVKHDLSSLALLFILIVCFRCAIPQCDNQPPDFEPPWLPGAVPYKRNTPALCDQHVFNSSELNNKTCSYDDFDKTRIFRCESFVYKTQERSILQEVSIIKA